ncbi:hypothetical protein FDECE_15574 [Fusarium decemcellulare]|nr:hypothetical protein FDECE_15574 [Fusarium decemcellulare]
MNGTNSTPTDDVEVTNDASQRVTQSRFQDDKKPNLAWTIVDVTEPQDATSDDDHSLVEISRGSSPLHVQFSDLNVADNPQPRMSWPTSLPWFQFQDRCLNSRPLSNILPAITWLTSIFADAAVRALFSKQLNLSSGVTRTEATSKKRLAIVSPNHPLTTKAGFNHAVSEANKVMPEQFDGQNAQRIKALISVDPLEAKMQEFQLFSYHLSNSLIDDQDDEFIDQNGKYTKIIKIFRDIGLSQVVWKDVFSKSLDQPTGRAFIEALFEAAVNTQELDICEALLEMGADPDKIIDTWAMGNLARPLQLSMDCRVRNVDLARLLIRFGAGVDLVTEEEPETALFKACKECTAEAVQVLVEAGTDLLQMEWNDDALTPDTALTNAVDADWRMAHLRDEEDEDELEESESCLPGLDTLKYLLPLYDQRQHHDLIQDAFIRAASEGRRDMIMDLVGAGACLNERSSGGHTALIAAASSSYKGSSSQTVKMLLELGAKVDLAMVDSSITALHIAAAKGDGKVTEVLVAYGADINAIAIYGDGEDWSLLGSNFDESGFALFRNMANESRYSPPKQGDAALVLIRAGAALEYGQVARACCFDSLDLLRELLSRGADVRELDLTGRSPLQACLEFKNLNLISHLLQAGASLQGCRLHSIIECGRRDVVEMLLRRGGSVNRDDGEYSLLEAAASNREWDMMAWLLEVHNAPYDEGALCAAICSGLGSRKRDQGYLKLLLQKRPDKMIGGEMEATALGYASFNNQNWVLKSLLKLKISGPCIIPVKDNDSWLHLVSGYPRIMSMAYKKPFWRDPAMVRCSILVPAIHGSSWEITEQLLEAGYKPDRLSLLVASRRESTGAILHLANQLSGTERFNRARSDLDTPLQAAVRHGRIDTARVLLSLGADVNAPASERLFVNCDWEDPILPRTALQAAIENSDDKMVALLLEVGAEINAPPGKDSGATALQIAAGKGHMDMVQRLLDLGADVNAEGATWNGRTALEAAAEGGRLDMVQLLLERGAGAGSDEGDGWGYQRATELAERRGFNAVVGVLRKWRRDADIKKRGRDR